MGKPSINQRSFNQIMLKLPSSCKRISICLGSRCPSEKVPFSSSLAKIWHDLSIICLPWENFPIRTNQVLRENQPRLVAILGVVLPYEMEEGDRTEAMRELPLFRREAKVGEAEASPTTTGSAMMKPSLVDKRSSLELNPNRWTFFSPL